MPASAPPQLRKIEREPLWDLAHAQLRDTLLAGRFAPGSSLTLRDLAQTFGISITPVRDAVTRLVRKGCFSKGRAIPRSSHTCAQTTCRT